MKVIHRVLCGSRLWGLHRPESDWDYRGVVITSLREKLYQSAGNKHRKSVTTDTTYYEFDHFLKLLQGGNPTVLETVLAPEEDSNLPDFNIYKVIDFDRMVGSAKGFAKSQLKQLSKHTDPQRRGKAVVSGLTGLSLIEMVSKQEGWNPPDRGTIALWKSIRAGDNLLRGTEMLREYLDKDYEVYRWSNYQPSTDYVKDLLLDTYMNYDELEGEEFDEIGMD